jgi:predicted oxidoreductase
MPPEYHRARARRRFRWQTCSSSRRWPGAVLIRSQAVLVSGGGIGTNAAHSRDKTKEPMSTRSGA